MVQVNFYKSLQTHTNVVSHNFEIEDFSSLYRGLLTIFPELGRLLKEELILIVYNKGKIIPDSWYLRNSIPKEIEELWIIPCIQGGGGKFGKIALGIAFVAAGFAIGGGFGAGGFQGFSGFSGFLGKSILGIGINLVLGALFQQDLAKPPPPPQNDASIRRNNDVFDGLTNTLAPETPVFLNYGLVRIPGQFVSGYIKTVGHGKTDIIEIGAFF